MAKLPRFGAIGAGTAIHILDGLGGVGGRYSTHCNPKLQARPVIASGATCKRCIRADKGRTPGTHNA